MLSFWRIIILGIFVGSSVFSIADETNYAISISVHHYDEASDIAYLQGFIPGRVYQVRHADNLLIPECIETSLFYCSSNEPFFRLDCFDGLTSTNVLPPGWYQRFDFSWFYRDYYYTNVVNSGACGFVRALDITIPFVSFLESSKQVKSNIFGVVLFVVFALSGSFYWRFR